ncbi:MAG: hypothetical protein MPJ50_03855 [Pirellulales bacterium]|nr:hypothetical protein [Pirellulales bacterium]
MPIKISCAVCGAALKAPDELQGKSVPCPKCQQAVTVPKLSSFADLEPVAAQGAADPLADLADLANQPVAGFDGQQLPGGQMPAAFGQPGGAQPMGGQAFPAQGFGGQQFGSGPKRRKKNKMLLFGSLGAGALVLIAAVVILIVTLTTGGGGGADPLDYMPANAMVIVQARPADFMDSGVYGQLQAIPAVSAAMNTAPQQMGLTTQLSVQEFLKSIDSVTVGMPKGLANPGMQTEPPLIIAMRFNRNYTLDDFATREEQSKWQSKTVAGKTVYTMPESGSQAMSLVDARTMIVGVDNLVSSALERGGAPQLSPVVQDLLDEADMSNQLVIISEADKEMMQGAALGGNEALAALTSVRGSLVQLNATSGLAVDALTMMADAQSAQSLVSEANTMLQTVQGEGASPIPLGPGIKQALQSIQVSADGTSIRASASVSESALQELSGLLQMFGGANAFGG